MNKHAYLNKDLKQPSTQLNGALTQNNTTTITVDDVTGFPLTGGRIKIGTTEVEYSAAMHQIMKLPLRVLILVLTI